MLAKFTLGTKENTSQKFSKSGERMPVTFIKTRPCYIVGVRTPDMHGYWGVQLAFGETRNISKPTQGVLKKAGIKAPLRFLKEVRIRTSKNPHVTENIEAIEEGKKKGVKIGQSSFFVGDEISAKIFAEGDLVRITGISKGKGFQGVVRRHKFAGGPRTHGQSDRERAPGSIGQGTTPGRIYKGKKMAGRMGGETTTVKNLTIIDANDEGVFVKGLIPGASGGLVTISSTNPILVIEKAVEEAVEGVAQVVTEEKAEEPIEDKEVETKEEKVASQ